MFPFHIGKSQPILRLLFGSCSHRNFQTKRGQSHGEGQRRQTTNLGVRDSGMFGTFPGRVGRLRGEIIFARQTMNFDAPVKVLGRKSRQNSGWIYQHVGMERGNWPEQELFGKFRNDFISRVSRGEYFSTSTHARILTWCEIDSDNEGIIIICRGQRYSGHK